MLAQFVGDRRPAFLLGPEGGAVAIGQDDALAGDDGALDLPGVNPVQDIADGGLRLVPDGPGGPGGRGDDERQGGGGHRPGAHRQPDPPAGEATGGGRLAAAKHLHALASWNQ